MKGFISDFGNLHILRGHEFKPQRCLFKEGICCGDWCPQMSEPIYAFPTTTNQEEYCETLEERPAQLSICYNKILEFTNFEDRRPKRKEK